MSFGYGFGWAARRRRAAVVGGAPPAILSLNDLDDVNTAGVEDGDELAYDSTSETWQPEAP